VHGNSNFSAKLSCEGKAQLINADITDNNRSNTIGWRGVDRRQDLQRTWQIIMVCSRLLTLSHCAGLLFHYSCLRRVPTRFSD